MLNQSSSHYISLTPFPQRWSAATHSPNTATAMTTLFLLSRSTCGTARSGNASSRPDPFFRGQSGGINDGVSLYAFDGAITPLHAITTTTPDLVLKVESTIPRREESPWACTTAPRASSRTLFIRLGFLAVFRLPTQVDRPLPRQN